MLPRRVNVCALAFLLLLTSNARAHDHPLLVGVRLAETRFKDWRYGHRLHRNQVNCVLFMTAVVEDLLRRPLTADERAAILISNVRRGKRLQQLVARDDERIRGIQTALVKMGNGEIVTPHRAQPGDFIQFWKYRNGHWRGHTSIIVDVLDRNGSLCAIVFGAHQTLGGVGIGEFEVGLNDPDIKSYIVRFKP